MTKDELHELCVLTLELTRLRQNECKHLAIENFAPEVLRDLISVGSGFAAERERWEKIGRLAQQCAEWHELDGDEFGHVARELLELLNTKES